MEPTTIGMLRAVPSTIGLDDLLAELTKAGYREGQNLRILGRDPDEVHTDPTDITETVQAWRDDGLDLLFAFSTTGAETARAAIPGVPILFLVNDPKAVGLVEDESAPEGNLTGVTFRVPADRTIDLAARVIPDLARVGLVYPSTDPAAQPHHEAVRLAADRAEIELVADPFTSDADVVAALDAIVGRAAQVLLVSNSPLAVRSRVAISAANGGRLPVIANTMVIEDAFLVLEPDIDQLYTQLGRQASRILGGASPRSVPVEDPRRYRVVIREAAANAQGISLPDDLLREADEVIR